MKKQILLFLLLSATITAVAQSGIAWQAPIDVATSTYGNEHPRVVVDATGNPLILFGNSNSDKGYFSRWNGSAFITPIVINPMSTPVFAQAWAGPDIASKGDTVYVVYKQTPEDTGHIYIRRSFDGGKNFSSPSRVDFMGNNVSRFPTITVNSDGNPLVAFMKFNATFGEAHWVVTQSNDFGNTFLPEVVASKYSGGDACDCCPGSIATSGNSVAMLYRDNLNNIRDTWVGISTNKGTTFPNGMAVDKQNWMLMACPSSGPDGVIIGDTIYSVFMSKYAVYANRNSISNLNSSTGKRITTNTTGITEQNYPRIANADRAVAQVWKQVRNNKSEVGLYFAADIIKGFPANYDIVGTNNSNSITNTDVAIYKGAVHVVWQDDNSGTIKYRKGTYATTGIQETLIQPIVALFPNPATNQITINFNQLKTVSFTVFNALGQSVKKLETDNNGIAVISLANWEEGLYFINATNTKENLSSSFLINRE